MTAAGKQCRNQVKVSDAQALAGGDVFCRVHGNKVGEVSGFYDRKTGQTFVKFEGECDASYTSFSLFSLRTFVRALYAGSHERASYADWIPEYLQTATQNALRVEMQKARTQSDVEGYIYAFEILGTAPHPSPQPAYFI